MILQAWASDVGLLKVATVLSPTATQSDKLQDTPFSSCLTGTIRQALAAPVGLREVSTWPAASTATHQVLDRHETPSSEWLRSTRTTCQLDLRSAGSVEVITSTSSTTAQKDTDGHDTAAERQDAAAARGVAANAANVRRRSSLAEPIAEPAVGPRDHRTSSALAESANQR
jgi:hypothetical protein